MPPKDEALVLKQFREDLVKEDLLHEGDSIGTDDETLLRFLRARHFNLKNAKIMWKNCYNWRETTEGVGIDELYRQIDPFDYPERDHVFKFWPLFFHKTDKRGRPINIHHFGRINTTELYKGVTPVRFWQAFLVNADSLTREVLPAASAAAGKRIDGTFVIVDLKGFGTGQFWQMKSLARGAFQVSQDYFPETMSQLAIVNAPSSFTAIWSVMRPWLAKETVEKVNVLGSNFSSYLLNLIEPEALPKSLGGKCTCEECGEHHEGKDRPEVGGVEGQVEMGKCAFSSAGPWMTGRKERREGWLKGERDIALSHGELQEYSNKSSSTSQPLETENSPNIQQQPQERADSVTSADDYSGPSTPALEQQMSQVSIHRDSDEDENNDEQSNAEEGAGKARQELFETRASQTPVLSVAS
ncbi:CRAL-TRIO domain-containing protein [Irpex rosettiformis]|uniref:CRAL-TRIO domain-containing protein n=1 Tax=Irpex rosettiformis TaxID=378272 RepID=A0ACB8TX79_9APHY|nr:CRAL-TRIO domain-containing protein [Irpex rosettiformis]